MRSCGSKLFIHQPEDHHREPTMSTLLPEVSAFLNSSPIKQLIGGEWVDAAGGGTLETRDPGDGKVIATFAAGDARDVDAAVSAAHEAFRKSGWATLPSNDRAVHLHRLADLVDKRREILAQIESLDVGKPIEQARRWR